MDSFENWDSDEDNGSELVAFVDYSDRGWWVVGFCVCENGKRPRVWRVLDQDKDINRLVNRAVDDHGLDPERLILSPIAADLVNLQLSTGMKI